LGLGDQKFDRSLEGYKVGGLEGLKVRKLKGSVKGLGS